MFQKAELCPHYGSCGGCVSQDIAYDIQLQHKASFLEKLLCTFWADPIPIVPSPVLFHYRNKIDPGFALKRYPEPPPADFVRESILGFKERGRWRWTVDIADCFIGPEGVRGLLESLRRWRIQSGLTAYDTRKGKGYLRNLLVRDGKRSGERMVVIITAPGALPDADAFVAAVQEQFPADSIFHGEFSRRAEVATAEKLTLLHGVPWITETLHVSGAGEGGEENLISATPAHFIRQDQRKVQELRFRISPLSFFQTNPLAAERLYRLVRDWVCRIRPGSLYDLYGGAGGIAFCCAQYAETVISVESVPEASEDGRFNAAQNGISNVSFVTATVREFLSNQAKSGGLPPGSAVIVDPPRGGMHPKVLKRLLEMRPAHILYVSCNPQKLLEDLAVFSEAYAVVSVEAVDMFPHTPHVETVAALELR
ncbi:MAG: 23S rRNA (uracil-C(5))-methyltransferase RlmCD [Candidatus Hydrogenedentes bacterium ADurb.Bin101]|jgi:23S rRNA (uracil1939-C5)-methyltransferase|nr:MAG: 23S rRNA (uracil-C(5))-methyltransferase RlmCD [Candidatus Hydrogenedentes bacterium ADurb.Bin101]HOC69922.1 hypothetical protein [Candidatus Hydrogenedentota bacterium]